MRLNEDNKLSRKKKTNSFGIAPKANFVELVVKFHNKNQKPKLVNKGKSIVKPFNGSFFYNKTRHLVKGYRNKAQQSNPKKIMITEVNINEIDYLVDKVLEMNMFIIVFEVNLIKCLN